MKRLIVAMVLGLLIFSNLAFADDLFQYSVNSNITENGYVYNELNIILLNKSAGRLEIPIKGEHSYMSLDSNIPCKYEKRTVDAVVFCDFPTNTPKETIIIRYSTEAYAKDGYYVLSSMFRIPLDTDTFRYLLRMPEGMGIKEGSDSYIPDDASLGSDGRRSILVWSRQDVQAGTDMEFSLAYEDILKLNYVTAIIAVVGLVVFLSVLWIFYKLFLKKTKQDPVKLIMPVLKEDEKRVFESLQRHGTGVNQKIIVRESGYSKGKVSKVLKSLQERGLLKLERVGRSNKVHFDSKLKKEAQETLGNNDKEQNTLK